MARCGYCSSTILFGGARDGDRRYCSAKCRDRGMLISRAGKISADELRRRVQEVFHGPCPRCGGHGPIDVVTSHRIWSALLVTHWSSNPRIACRACGLRAQAGDGLYSLLLGWWGFPWGLIMTPVQLARNVAGMLRSSPSEPTPALASLLELELAAERTPDRSFRPEAG